MLILQQYPNTWSLGHALSKGTNHCVIVTIFYMTLFSHCFGGHTAAVYHLFRCPMWTSEWGLYSIMKVETGVLSSTKLLWAPVKGVTSTPANLFFEVNDKRVMDYAQFYLIRAKRGRIMKSTSHVKLDCEHVCRVLGKLF